MTARAASPKTRLADAALRLLARRSWGDLSLAEVARGAKLPLATLQDVAPSKAALIGFVLARLGEATAAAYRPGRDAGSARDRLFDVGMAWFDVLARHKKAVRHLYEGLRGDPVLMLSLRGEFVAAASWLMTLAEADAGPALALRALAFALALGRAVPVWLDDDADLTKTMARLDGDLARGADWLSLLTPKA